MPLDPLDPTQVPLEGGGYGTSAFADTSPAPATQDTAPAATANTNAVPLDAITTDPSIVALDDLLGQKVQQLNALSATFKPGDTSQQYTATQINELQRDITTLQDTKAHVLDDISKGKATDARAALRLAAQKDNWEQQHLDRVAKEFDDATIARGRLGIQQQQADTAASRAKAYQDYLAGRKTTLQQEADTRNAQQQAQAQHWQNQDDNAAQLQKLTAARDKADADAKAALDQYHQHMADILSRHYDNQDDAKKASDELQSWYDAARVASQQAQQARQDWQAQQDIVLRQQQLDISSQQNAESRASAIVTAAQQAADRESQNTREGAATGAGLLNTRVTNARDSLNSILSMANNKNFGLGSVPNVTGLPGAIGDWLTQLGGGADTYQTAANLVHQANPSVSGTASGAGFTGVLHQMLDAFNQVSGASQPLIQQNKPDFTQPAQGQAFPNSPAAPAPPQFTAPLAAPAA